MSVICVKYIRRFQTVTPIQKHDPALFKAGEICADISKKTKDGSINEYRNAASKCTAALAFRTLAASNVIKT